MNKLKNKSGFTLIEMLLSIMILVFLVIGMGAGTDSGMRVYSQSIFESQSSSLAGILNTAIGDILRYSEDVQKNPGTFKDYDENLLAKEDVDFVFTSYDYGVRNAYFAKILSEENNKGVVQMRNLDDNSIVDLVNTGAYPSLRISDLKITYFPPKTPDADGSGRGGYFDVHYLITDATNSGKKREVNTSVRLMNAVEVPTGTTAPA